MMREIEARQVHELLGYTGLVEALKTAHCAPFPLVDHIQMQSASENGMNMDSFLVLPAWQPGEAFGIKSVTVIPGNAQASGALPAVQAVYLLFDGKNGSPLAIIDGTALTARKTAADSALGASFLARHDAKTMLMIGAGAMAPHLIMAHKAIRPALKTFLIWNRSPARAQAIAHDLEKQGFAIEVTDNLPEAVKTADIISCATAATTPVLKGTWLKPGTHIDLVGGFTKEMRESDDETIRRAGIFVDSRQFTINRVGDINAPLTNGVISPDDIKADLFELSQGICEGRQSADEITLFKNGGGSHLDLFTARHLFAQIENP